MAYFEDAKLNFSNIYCGSPLILCMTGELWMSSIFWHPNIRVTHCHSRAMSFVFTFCNSFRHGLLPLNSCAQKKWKMLIKCERAGRWSLAEPAAQPSSLLYPWDKTWTHSGTQKLQPQICQLKRKFLHSTLKLGSLKRNLSFSLVTVTRKTQFVIKM